MKIRQGFVSNSSSSSFVVCIKKDAYLKTLETYVPSEEIVKWLDENEMTLEELFSEWYDDEKDVFKIPCVIHSSIEIQGYDSEEYDEVVYEEIERFESLISDKDKAEFYVSG